MDEENQLKLEGLEVTEEEFLSTDRSSQYLDKELTETQEKEKKPQNEDENENLDNKKKKYSRNCRPDLSKRYIVMSECLNTMAFLEKAVDGSREVTFKRLIPPSPVDGELDEDIVYENISCIQTSDHGSLQNLTFSGVNLKLRDISILSKYTHLQSVDVSNNQISDLSVLGNLHFLLILNASHNHIAKLLDFQPPKNLKHANFSHNSIEEIPDLAAHHYLAELHLDNNRISEIKGLSECHRLSKLSLSHNKISKIKNIESLPLLYLNLSNNQISQVENLETLCWLREIDLSCNLIRSLQGLAKHHLLESINVNDNQIQNIEEIHHIKDLILLRSFTILRNPIVQLFNYHLAILFQIQRLLELNGSPVAITDKVEALNQFDPCLEVVAAKTHMMLTFYSFLKPCRILDITMSNINDPYPMLVMVGPEGSENKRLAMGLAEEFSENFGYGILETTREMLPGEVDGKDYNFTTHNHFHQEVVSGEFIVTSHYRGNYYGLKSKTLESIAQEGKGCITHMKLEAMVTLKNSYLQPRFILTVHSSRQAQKTYMNTTGLYTNEELEHALHCWDAITEYNQEHPGAFFIVIIIDHLESAYQKLEQLVRSWIGNSEKLPRLSPIGNLLEMETGLSRSSGVAEELIYTAPVVGFVEEESLKRRYQALKKVVQAYVPPLYEQISRSTSSGSRVTYARSLSQSAQPVDQQPSTIDSDDESSDVSLNTSLTSNPTSTKLSAPVKCVNQMNEVEEHLIKTSERGSVDQLVLFSGMDDVAEDSGLNSKTKTYVVEPTAPSTPRPKTSSSSQRTSRLGSAKHTVIPPITTEN